MAFWIYSATNLLHFFSIDEAEQRLILRDMAHNSTFTIINNNFTNNGDSGIQPAILKVKAIEEGIPYQTRHWCQSLYINSYQAD
jgi:hypothetical protein